MPSRTRAPDAVIPWPGVKSSPTEYAVTTYVSACVGGSSAKYGAMKNGRKTIGTASLRIGFVIVRRLLSRPTLMPLDHVS